MSQLTYDQLAGAVIQLPIIEQRRLLTLISSRLEKNGSAEPVSPSTDEQPTDIQASIDRSHLWLQANRENYRGEWVVLKDGELIAHGKGEMVAVREALALGVKSPFIAFIPEENLPWAGF